MNTDLLMFVVGMFMALIVSFLGLLLAYISWRKRDRRGSVPKMESEDGGIANG